MKRPILVTTIVILFLSSCSTETNNNNNNNNDPDPSDYLVLREFVNNDVNLEYSYNENDQLTTILDKDIQENIDTETTFSYESNNVITRNIVSNNSNTSAMNSYVYGADNKIETVMSEINNGLTIDNITQTFVHNSNIITATIIRNNEDPYEIVLILNSLGLINEIIRDDYYVIITYFANGNISEINSYDNDDNLLNSVGYIYDNKPNPFYGKLESIYVPLFLNAFNDAVFGEYVWEGYEGYYFPFLQNNITMTTFNGNIVTEYEYTYDEFNYPTQVSEIFNGINALDFSIEYE